jgi:hypothetical protein
MDSCGLEDLVLEARAGTYELTRRGGASVFQLFSLNAFAGW